MLREITDQLLAGGSGSVDAHMSEIRNFITRRLGDLRTLLARKPVEARSELLNHVSEIKMIPQSGDRKPHYVAEGSWHLLGIESDSSDGAFTQIRMVAGLDLNQRPLGYEALTCCIQNTSQGAAGN